MIAVFLALIYVAKSQVPFPIQSPMDGFYQGPGRSNYTLEVFIDHLSPECKISYPAVQQFYNQSQT